MRIYLLGYMGCGKTTAGKKLAQKIDYTFVDLDDVLEKNQGRTISEIFAKDGEDVFRQIEKETLHSTFNLDNVIIATGGGAPCFFDNVEQMNQHGLTIYIDMTPTDLVERLAGQIEHRPILKGKTHDELMEFIGGALEKRNPFYTKAKASVDGVSLSADSLFKAMELHQGSIK